MSSVYSGFRYSTKHQFTKTNLNFLLDAFLIVSQLHLAAFVRRHLLNPEVNWLNFCLQLVTAEIVTLFIDATFTIYAHVCILTASLAIVQMLLISGQLKKLATNLKTERKNSKVGVFHRKLALFAFNRFLRESVACLRLVNGNAGHFISRAFTAYLVVNLPLSCTLGALLLVTGRKINTAFYLFTAAFMVQQWVCTFGFHLFIVGVNRLIHRPVRRLMQLQGTTSDLPGTGRSLTSNDFRMQLKLSAYIAAYHVRSERRYGFAYWKLSLNVTMMTFAEVVFK